MKNTLKLITILCLTMLAVFCAREKNVEPATEKRWLRVYHDGEFKWRIDVTDWEINEDVIHMGYFYYPWQGEDSIDYTEYASGYETSYFGGPYLKVNGKVVGVNLGRVPSSEIQNPEKIITATIDEWELELDPEDLKNLPNLIGIWWGGYSGLFFGTLKAIPSHIRLYLILNNITDADFRELSKLENIRVLQIDSDSLTYHGLRYLCRFKELRRFELISPKIQRERLRCLHKLKKLRYWYVESGMEI